ncbi:hypothetical protein Tco_1165612 [Tanacetum coccineum]
MREVDSLFPCFIALFALVFTIKLSSTSLIFREFKLGGMVFEPKIILSLRLLKPEVYVSVICCDYATMNDCGLFEGDIEILRVEVRLLRAEVGSFEACDSVFMTCLKCLHVMFHASSCHVYASSNLTSLWGGVFPIALHLNGRLSGILWKVKEGLGSPWKIMEALGNPRSFYPSKIVECSSKADLFKTKYRTEDPCRDKSVTSGIRASRFEEMANEIKTNAASGSTRVAGVETSMAELKTQVDGLEGLDSYFTSMREDFPEMEQYLEGVNVVDDASKIKMVTRYLKDTQRYNGDVGMEISSEVRLLSILRLKLWQISIRNSIRRMLRMRRRVDFISSSNPGRYGSTSRSSPQLSWRFRSFPTKTLSFTFLMVYKDELRRSWSDVEYKISLRILLMPRP